MQQQEKKQTNRDKDRSNNSSSSNYNDDNGEDNNDNDSYESNPITATNILRDIISEIKQKTNKRHKENTKKQTKCTKEIQKTNKKHKGNTKKNKTKMHKGNTNKQTKRINLLAKPTVADDHMI